MTVAVAGVDQGAELDNPELRLSDEDLAWLNEIGQREGEIIGSTEPRIFTKPLRDLDDPDSTLGYDVIAFAQVMLGLTLLPWQEWWLIHALELLPDGKLRFQRIITLVARQNGKTFLITVLALYWLYVRGAKLVLGTAQKVETAKESWSNAYDLAADNDELAAEFLHNQRGRPGRWDGSGAVEIRLTDGRRYRVSPSTPGAARGLSVDLLIMDEIRQQKDDKAWAALSKTTAARAESLIVAISNAGEEDSVVLNRLRAAAISGKLDGLAIFEWSAPDGCALNDVEGWKAANPSLGYYRSLRGLALDMVTDEAGTFRIECLCQRVIALDVLFDPNAWASCGDPALTLDAVKRKVCLGFDMAPDGAHATLVAAALRADGKVALEVVARWTLPQMAKMPAEVQAWAAKIKPVKIAWFPAGPAAAEASKMRKLRRTQEISAVTEACQELVHLVATFSVAHGHDALLTTQVLGTRKLEQGDGYRFVRRGAGHCDAVYAAAAAAKMARNIKPGGSFVV